MWVFNNMDPKSILPDSQTFLRDRRLVPEKSIPYFALWANKYMSFSCNSSETDTTVTVTQFLESIKSNRSVEEWQVRQTEGALRLYLYHFKGKDKVNPEASVRDLPTILHGRRFFIVASPLFFDVYVCPEGQYGTFCHDERPQIYPLGACCPTSTM